MSKAALSKVPPKAGFQGMSGDNSQRSLIDSGVTSREDVLVVGTVTLLLSSPSEHRAGATWEPEVQSCRSFKGPNCQGMKTSSPCKPRESGRSSQTTPLIEKRQTIEN